MIPKSMQERNQWVVWKTVIRNDEPTKVPFQPNGRPASSTDPSTWSTFFAVNAAMELGSWDGIGYVFSKDDPFTGIDLDGCVGEQVEPWALEIIKNLDSYTEMSPSRTGVHIVVQGEFALPKGKNKRLSETSGIEIYSHSRFFCVTGKRGKTCPHEPEPRQAQLDALTYQYFESEMVLERARQYVDKIEPAISGQRGHDKTFRVACILTLGFGLGELDALTVLREFNAKCDPPWSEPDLLHKVRDSLKQPGPRNYLRTADKADWTSIKVPKYEVAPDFGSTVQTVCQLLDSLDVTNRKTVLAALRGRYG